jgi:hypothetical protein
MKTWKKMRRRRASTEFELKKEKKKFGCWGGKWAAWCANLLWKWPTTAEERTSLHGRREKTRRRSAEKAMEELKEKR